jgi:molybdate transport system ATP-binding protein
MSSRPMSLEIDVQHEVGTFALGAKLDLPRGLGVLLGPSGAGKSLTLRLLAGLERPARGRIVCDGEIWVDTAGRAWRRPQDRRVGMVFQDALLLPHRTVLANVAMAVRAARPPERKRAALAWLERVGAAELACRRPAGLSGGQRQRVALARALAGQPRLLLLDEPFGALHLEVRRELRELVRKLVAEHALSALLVTHDRDEAAALADCLIVAETGTITRIYRGAEIAAQLLTNHS